MTRLSTCALIVSLLPVSAAAQDAGTDSVSADLSDTTVLGVFLDSAVQDAMARVESPGAAHLRGIQRRIEPVRPRPREPGGVARRSGGNSPITTTRDRGGPLGDLQAGRDRSPALDPLRARCPRLSTARRGGDGIGHRCSQPRASARRARPAHRACARGLRRPRRRRGYRALPTRSRPLPRLVRRAANPAGGSGTHHLYDRTATTTSPSP